MTAPTTFSLTENPEIVRGDDGSWYNIKTSAAYKKWLAEGGVPTPYVPPVKPPEQVKLEADKAAVRQYAKLQALAAMSPAEVTAWVEANVKTLPDAKDTIATLAVAVSILARQL